MVKERISATVDPETMRIIGKVMKRGKYRNKAHFIEEAIKVLAKEEEKK